jgi:NitT/TauT family transport system substrate-binding protein
MRRFRVVMLVAVLIGLALPAGATEKLRIGVLKLASSGPVFIALDKGYFSAGGLDVDLHFFHAAQPIAVATVAGDVDVGITGLTGGFYNLAGKGGLKIIAAQSREEPGYKLIAYLAGNKAYDAGLKQIKDLPGHSVGVTQIGSTFHYSLGLLSEKLSFPLSKIRLVPLQSMSNEGSALAGNQVDAALLPATVALPLVSSGKAHLLGWVGDETPWQLGAVFTTNRMISEHRSELAAFIAAYRHAAHDFYDAFLTKGADGRVKEGASAPALVAIIAKYTGQKPAQIRNGIPYIDPNGKLLVRDIYHQVAWYQSQGLVDKSVDAHKILDLSFVGQKDTGK